MSFFRVLLSGWKLSFLSFAAVIAPLSLAQAQSGAVSSKDGLAVEQARLFQQMFAQPDDLDLMFAYARVSAEMEDYEGAISTLERALTYNRRVPELRVELGALHFNIGAYGAAESYFAMARASGALDAAQEQRVATYLEEIARRTAPARFSGEVVGGLAYSSNANAGPDDALVLSGGAPALTREGESDVGAFMEARIRYDHDLGGPDTDIWRSDVSARVTEFFDENDGDLAAIALRTGPVLSLDPLQYGPKLRPFVEFDYVSFADRALYGTAGGGLQYGNTLSDRWFLFAEASLGRRFFDDRFNDESGVIGRGLLGAAFKPTRDLVLKGQFELRGDWAEQSFNSNTYLGARIEAEWRYDPGFALAERKWVLKGFASAGYADYDSPEAAIDPSRAREESTFRLGLSHTFNLSGGAFIRAEGSTFRRDANIPNYDLTIHEIRLGIGLDF